MTDFLLPCLIAGILLVGLFKGVPVFDLFLKGAGEGLSLVKLILPALVALITCVGMFNASGGLDLIANGLAPLVEAFGLPRDVVPLALLRPISGSGSLVIFEKILAEHGPDSFVGRVASVLFGSTETTFYTIALYFSAASIKKTGPTLPSALTADLVGFLLSGIFVTMFFVAG